MSSYKDLLSQIEQLKIEAEETRKRELSSAIAEIRQRMAELGISIEDLAGTAKRTRRGSPAATKYRDPASGQTWSGRGRTPRWIVAAEAQGKARDSFLVG